MSNDGRYFIIEFPLREALEEVASGVFEYTGLNNELARDICFYYFHKNFLNYTLCVRKADCLG